MTPRDDDVVLDLDPGMAFGTGLHPTTRLCLAALEDTGVTMPRACLPLTSAGPQSSTWARARAYWR